MVDRSDDASCLLGLEGLAVERVVLTGVGVKIVQLIRLAPSGDPDGRENPRGRSFRPVRAGLSRPAARPRR